MKTKQIFILAILIIAVAVPQAAHAQDGPIEATLPKGTQLCYLQEQEVLCPQGFETTAEVKVILQKGPAQYWTFENGGTYYISTKTLQDLGILEKAGKVETETNNDQEAPKTPSNTPQNLQEVFQTIKIDLPTMPDWEEILTWIFTALVIFRMLKANVLDNWKNVPGEAGKNLVVILLVSVVCGLTLNVLINHKPLATTTKIFGINPLNAIAVSVVATVWIITLLNLLPEVWNLAQNRIDVEEDTLVIPGQAVDIAISQNKGDDPATVSQLMKAPPYDNPKTAMDAAKKVAGYRDKDGKSIWLVPADSKGTLNIHRQQGATGQWTFNALSIKSFNKDRTLFLIAVVFGYLGLLTALNLLTESNFWAGLGWFLISLVGIWEWIKDTQKTPRRRWQHMVIVFTTIFFWPVFPGWSLIIVFVLAGLGKKSYFNSQGGFDASLVIMSGLMSMIRILPAQLILGWRNYFSITYWLISWLSKTGNSAGLIEFIKQTIGG